MCLNRSLNPSTGGCVLTGLQGEITGQPYPMYSALQGAHLSSPSRAPSKTGSDAHISAASAVIICGRLASSAVTVRLCISQLVPRNKVPSSR